MLLSRFWYVVTAILLGVAAFILFIAAQVYNRTNERAMAEALSADSSAVGWYLKDDARNRSSALIAMALDPDLRAALTKTSAEAKPSAAARNQAAAALKKLAAASTETKFDVLWAVDAQGRVIADVGYAYNEDWQLGGFAAVADALHGWVRDDTWVWDSRILRVVTRPVEQEVNALPVGAIVGVKYVDDTFADMVSQRTGAAVAFYAHENRVASGVPEGSIPKAHLDQITSDLKQSISGSKDYQEKGRSEVRTVGGHLGIVYAKLPGEAWDLGSGFAVARAATTIDSPIAFLGKANEKDKSGVPSALLGLGALGVAVIGLFFSYVEHTRPLGVFAREATELAQGKVDMLQPSRFRGAYKQIAADINDGIEKVVVKGGGSRRAADLEQVLGPIPTQPAMSAFAVPGPDSAPAASSKPVPSAPASIPKPRPSVPTAPSAKSKPFSPSPLSATVVSDASDPPAAAQAGAPKPPAPKPPTPAHSSPQPPSAKPKPPSAPKPSAPAASEPEAPALEASPEPEPHDEGAEWKQVYEDFVALKRQCGEPTSGLTFEKFTGTLERNKAALVARHGCSRVKFTVYAKDGKAALKASPIK